MDAETKFFTHQLFRHRCPTTFDVGEYSLGLLDGNHAQQLTHHLARCPHCRRELAGYQSALDIASANDPAPSWGTRLRVWLAKREQLAAGYALRGDVDEPLIFSAENGSQIALNIQPDPNGNFSIIGVVIGTIAATIDLWRGDTLQSQVHLDELGNFQLDNLPPDTYQLLITSTEFMLHIDTLTVG